jgi:hypothetical protein
VTRHWCGIRRLLIGRVLCERVRVRLRLRLPLLLLGHIRRTALLLWRRTIRLLLLVALALLALLSLVVLIVLVALQVLRWPCRGLASQLRAYRLAELV